MKLIIRAMLAALVCAPIQFAAAQDEESDAGWHGGAWLVSDYDFRGVTQSQGDPAAQAELFYQFGNGLYLGLWGSSVDYTADGAPDDGVDFELDPYIGWAFDLAERWSADVILIRQIYPSDVDDVDYDYTELEAKLWLDERFYAHVGYSNDVFNLDESGTYVAAGFDWEIADTAVALIGHAGHYDLDDAAGDGYNDWALGVRGTHGPFVWKLEYVDTTSYDDALIDSVGEPADGEVVATVGLEF